MLWLTVQITVNHLYCTIIWRVQHRLSKHVNCLMDNLLFLAPLFIIYQNVTCNHLSKAHVVTQLPNFCFNLLALFPEFRVVSKILDDCVKL